MGEDCLGFCVSNKRMSVLVNERQDDYGLNCQLPKTVGSKEETETLFGTQTTSTANQSGRNIFGSANDKFDSIPTAATFEPTESCCEVKVNTMSLEAYCSPFRMRCQEESRGHSNERAAVGRTPSSGLFCNTNEQQLPCSSPIVKHDDEFAETYPFNERQKAQLYAQIRVYGALMDSQRSAPSEDLMQAAFSDFVSESVEENVPERPGRDVWERQWRAAITRLPSESSPSQLRTPHHLDIWEAPPSQAFEKSPNSKHSLHGVFGNQCQEVASLAVASSPPVILESWCCSPSNPGGTSEHASPINTEFLLPYGTVSTSVSVVNRTEEYASETIESVAPHKMETNSEAGPCKRKRSFETRKHDTEVVPDGDDTVGHSMTSTKVCSFMFPKTLSGSFPTFPELYNVDVQGPKSSVFFPTSNRQSLHLENSVNLKDLREHAEQASILAARVTSDSESLWQDLKLRNRSNLDKDAEIQIVSSIISTRAAATIANAAAAAARAAYDAAMHANIMRKRTLRHTLQDGPQQSGMLHQALEDFLSTGFEIAPKESTESKFLAVERSESLKALVTAGVLTSNAVSQIRTAMTLGESDFFTLSELMEIGLEDVESLTSSKESEKAPKEMKMANIPLQDESQNIEGFDASGRDEQVEAERYTPFIVPSTVIGRSDNDPCMGNMELLDASSNIKVEANVESLTFDGKEMVENSAVEVLSDEASLHNVWRPAKVLKLDQGKVLRQYEVQSVNGINTPQEWISLDTAFSEVPRIQLAYVNNFNSKGGRKRSREELENQKWAVGDIVDIWIHAGWREGKIIEVFDDSENTVKVFVPGGVSQLVKSSNIRPSLRWNNKKWVSSSRECNDMETNEDCPVSKRQKIEETQCNSAKALTLSPNDPSSICKVSSREERAVSTQDMQCKFNEHGSNITFGSLKSFKKERLTTVLTKKEAWETASEKVNGCSQKTGFHRRTESVEKPSAKGAVSQTFKEKQISSDKASVQEGNVNPRSSRLKQPLSQLHPNISSNRRLPLTNTANVDPSRPVRRNGNIFSRAGKQQNSSFLKHSKKECSGNVLQAVKRNEKDIHMHEEKENESHDLVEGRCNDSLIAMNNGKNQSTVIRSRNKSSSLKATGKENCPATKKQHVETVIRNGKSYWQ